MEQVGHLALPALDPSGQPATLSPILISQQLRGAVPDLTTTVLTMTLTGIAADTSPSGRGATIVRRLLAVSAMFAGAIIGALIVLHDGQTASLSLAVGLLAVVTISALIVARKPRPSHTTGT